MRRKILDENGINFLTFTIVDWVDLFTRPIYVDIFLESLRYCQKEKQLTVHAYVIMSSHVHCILSTPNPEGISSIITSIKSFTAKRILDYILNYENIESRRAWLLDRFAFNAKKNKRDSEYQIWQYENYPVDLYSPRAIRKNVNYIHLNPVVAGHVDNPKDYRYSSARDYEGEAGLIEIDVLDISEGNEIGWVG